MAVQLEERWVAGFDRYRSEHEKAELLCGTILVKETAKQCVVVDRRGMEQCVGYKRIFPAGSFYKTKLAAVAKLETQLYEKVLLKRKEVDELERRLDLVIEEIHNAH